MAGNAQYLGYVKGCTVFLDLNGDGAHGTDEPNTISDDYGGWTFTVEDSLIAGAASSTQTTVVVKSGATCIDRYTDKPLAVSISAGQTTGETAGEVEACPVVSILSTVMKEMVTHKLTGSSDNLEAAITATKSDLKTALGLAATSDFDPCKYDPVDAVWDDDPARRRSRALVAAEGVAALGRKLSEGGDDVLSAVMGLQLQLMTVVEQISTVAGFQGEDEYAASASAVLETAATQIETTATTNAEFTAFETAELVTAATEATSVTLGDDLADTLATSVAASAEYVANKTYTVIAAAESGDETPEETLTDLGQLATVAQAKDTQISVALETAASEGTSDLSTSSVADTLETRLAEVATTEALDASLQETVSTWAVETPMQAPSPPPMAPPPSPAPTPPPPPAVSEEEENVSTGGDDDDDLAALVLLALPVLFFLYVAVRYGPSGNFHNYINWRFSHSNPHMLMGYRPKEARDELEAQLFSKVKKFTKDDMTTSTTDAPKKDVGAHAAGPSASPPTDEKSATLV